MNVCSRVSAVFEGKKCKKKMLQVGLCDWTEGVWSVWVMSISPTSRLKDAECCVTLLAPLLLGYADLSVQWGSGLYTILSNVSACFLEGLIHEITLSDFFFYYKHAETGRFLFLFLWSTDPKYREPMFKMNVWMSGKIISCLTLPFYA